MTSRALIRFTDRRTTQVDNVTRWAYRHDGAGLLELQDTAGIITLIPGHQIRYATITDTDTPMQVTT